MSTAEGSRNAKKARYKMTISLNVLNHLGIGLYSNVPAVLSEVVANAWDADAGKVTIEIDGQEGRIVVQDDGNGMDEKDINDRYLTVGYQKRKEITGKTKKDREPMGRKGIGKLSVFSIAETVEVYSAKGRERNAFRMNSEDIKKKMEEPEKSEDYYPDPIDTSPIDFGKGTKIVLKDLKKGLTSTAAFLRRRLARRFSVIGAARGFEVVIGGKPITTKDRGYYDKIEFLWHMGERRDLDEGFFKDGSARTNLKENIREAFELDSTGFSNENWSVRGWIGTVDEQKSIDEENNAITIFARGKLIHEDVLGDLKEGGIFSKYLIGEVNADFMDLNDQDDIVTSDRQSVKQDDERYEELKELIRKSLKTIQNRWSDLRNDVGTDRATEHPSIKLWYERQKGQKSQTARKMFGRIESLVLSPSAKAELYKSSMLAFERLALKDSLDRLESLQTNEDFKTLAELFGAVDEIEAVHYHQIVTGRLSVIDKLEQDMPSEAEKAVQQHVFNHLWLVDPSWERATESPTMEKAFKTEFDKTARLTKEEADARFDIGYRTAAGKHVIVELKKFGAQVNIYDLMKQVDKYKSAVQKCLDEQFQDERTKEIEIVCLLEKPPTPRAQDLTNKRRLWEVNARYVTYGDLITRAQKSYGEYLEKQKEVSQLLSLIDKVDQDFKPAP